MAQAEPFVGKKLTERTFSVSDNLLADYYNGLKLPKRDDGRVPTMVAADAENGYFGEIAFSNHIGHLWMRQEVESFQPMVAGQTYKCSGEIKDIYAHRNRNVVLYEVDVLNDDGEPMERIRHHQSFLQEVPEGGQVAFRKAGDKPGARKFDIPAGDRFGSLEREITLEMCGEYFHGDANYHTDKQASAELGFQDVVVGGRMTLAYAMHILEEHFGEEWWKSGRIEAKFTNPTWPGDTIAAHGIALGQRGTPRENAFVWLEKDDGTIVLVATAGCDA
jgi:hypothetical protein